MKKPKISLDSAKMKAFLLNHVEKIVLGVFVLAMLLMIWQGFSLQGLDANKKPGALISQSDQAMQFIDNPERWNEIKEARYVRSDVVDQVQISHLDAEAQAYPLVMQWNKPDFPKLSPRTDPELFAPERLVAIAIWGPLAVFAKQGELDPLAQLPPEDTAPVKKKPVKKKLAVDDGYGLDGGMPGDGMAPKRGKTKKGKAASTYAGEGMMPGGGGYGGLSGDGGGYGYGGGGVGMPGMPFPESGEVGYLPQNMESTIAKNVHAVTILATVPFQKQMEEYERTLGNSLDYDPSRDQFPWYLLFRIQRADVTNDPKAADEALEWKSLGVRRALVEALGQPGNEMAHPPVPPVFPTWAGFPTEVADPNYLAPGDLTHPAPPFLYRELWPLLVHPDVPLFSPQTQYGMAATGEAGAAGAVAAQNEDTPPVANMMAPGMGGMGGGMPGGGMPGGGMMGSSDGGGYGGGMPGMGGMGGYGGGAGMYGGAGGMGGAGGYGGGTAGMGGYGGGTAGMSDGGYGSAGMVYTPPKSKMIRFTDMNVEPGRKYRYRLQVLLNDPNHPYPTMIAPSAASLSEVVRKRIKPLDDVDLKNAKNVKPGQPQLAPGQAPLRSVYWVESPWSEPSDVVELPTPGRVYASKVTPGSRGNEPKADALAVGFDPVKVADIPIEQEGKVFRGSVLNYKAKELKVIHPVTKQVMTLTDDYSVSTNLLVADMMGGEKLPLTDRNVNSEPLTAPGELLVLDPQGNLHVRNEVDGIEGYRRYTVQKEDPKAAAAASSALDGGTAGLDGGSADGGGRGTRRPVRRGTGCF